VPIKGLERVPFALSGQAEILWVAAGKGPLRGELQGHAQAQGLDSLFCGQLSPSERDALLAEADLFLFPSRTLEGRTEGTPVSLLEALLAGVPVVAWNSGGVAEALKGSGALLVSDERSFREAAAAVLNQPMRAAQMRKQHHRVGAFSLWSQRGPEHAAFIKACLEKA